MKAFLCFLVLGVVSLADVNPPVWAEEWRQVFIESFKGTQKRVPGQIFYSAKLNMSKVERKDGEFEAFCGTLMPNVSTPCQHLVRDGKRWIVFPQKRFCCMCCDAAHGCGLLKRDWLKSAKYEGQQALLDQTFDKWSIPDGDVMDYYWATTDSKQILRKIDEGGARIKDFIMNTYNEGPIPEENFRLPDYCQKTCPSTSSCGRFQGPIVQEQ